MHFKYETMKNIATEHMIVVIFYNQHPCQVLNSGVCAVWLCDQCNNLHSLLWLPTLLMCDIFIIKAELVCVF